MSEALDREALRLRAFVIAHGARHRLAKLLGMTGSSHDGEALVAARMAGKLVRELGLTWEQAILPAAKPCEPPQAALPPDALRKARREGYEKGYQDGLAEARRALWPSTASWRAIAQDMLERSCAAGCRLSDWETTFLLSIVHRGTVTITARQREVFANIAHKLGMQLPGQARRARAASPERKGAARRQNRP
jgi:hypothetical protein